LWAVTADGKCINSTADVSATKEARVCCAGWNYEAVLPDAIWNLSACGSHSLERRPHLSWRRRTQALPRAAYILRARELERLRRRRGLGNAKPFLSDSIKISTSPRRVAVACACWRGVGTMQTRRAWKQTGSNGVAFCCGASVQESNGGPRCPTRGLLAAQPVCGWLTDLTSPQ